MNDLGWEIMRDHYRLLYLTSPGFRETVNWKSMSYLEMIHGSFWLRRNANLWGDQREAFIKEQHEKGVTALETVLQSIRRERPALAAEERHRGAEPVPRKLSIEEQRFKRMLLQDMISRKEAVRLNWYRKNQLQLEESRA